MSNLLGASAVAVSVTGGQLLLASGTAATSGSAPIDATGGAVFLLRSPQQPGLVWLTASYAGLTAADTFRFAPALPQRLVVAAGVSAQEGISAASIRITAQAFRDVGVPSVGRAISYTAAGPAGPTGPVTVQAATLSATGDSLRAATAILLQ